VRAVSLLYHDVVAGAEFDASGFPGPRAATYKLRVGDFMAHLAAIGETGARPPGRVSELAEPAPGDRADPPLLLTFDDGGVSAFATVAPLLAERSWPGHFLVATDYLGTRGFLTSEQVRALHRAGHIIGTHSRSHPARMSALPTPALEAEWRDSAARLTDLLGSAVTVGSVPAGAYSSRVGRAAAAAGIAFLFTSEPTTRIGSIEGCLVLGRFSLRRDSPPGLVTSLVTGAGGARVRQWLAWNARKAAKGLAWERYLALRRALLR
jgi:peptidoglycan/xylan/chitin deacetylase (PgdA/CDA1 family)